MTKQISDTLNVATEGHRFVVEVLLYNGAWFPCQPLTDEQVALLGQLCDDYLKKEDA